MRLFLFVILFFSVSISFAQFGIKGQKVVGGTLFFNTGRGSNSAGIEVLPEGYGFGGSISKGKFIKENLLETVLISYSHGYGKFQNSNNENRNYSNSIYVAYGFTKYKKIANSLFFGIGGNTFLSYNKGKYYNSTGPVTRELSMFSIGLYVFPTLSYQLSSRFVVNLTTSSQFLNLGYGMGNIKTYSSTQPTSKATYQSFNFIAGLFGSDLKNLNVGFNYLLKNKKTK